ncbi:DUF4229 domain-containing protein [Modestobacter muralis]|uniref:DUF4229 domain-containing protein n=1 Tax=Modestobacter muralis TaxID=1608614 RepID=A0A6P0ETE3_9ACTN|nr:DUF4229 domain-containing protein [Modestobacter muralis]NEK93244.1 DUF4229 domain-containing protein [Modestobacter muralis]NEN50011.1 DUF4229 domain-containing protein [Modestobacter muralis]
MAEPIKARPTEAGPVETGGSTRVPGEQPQVAKWLVVYTLGRLAIAAALIALLWVLGLPGTPGFLFGVLLAMPVAYLALAPVRTRLTTALVARAEHKERLRTELRGGDDLS